MKANPREPGRPAERDTGCEVDAAILLAGGLGTRLRSVVHDRPKVMAPVHGRPFLEYLLDFWIEQGIRRFILSVGYLKEIIQGHFGGKYRQVPIEYAPEEAPLGTGGALLLAARKLDTSRPFLLLNGDSLFEVDLVELVGFHTRCRSQWTFSSFCTNEHKRYMGLKIEECGRVVSLQSDPGSPVVAANGGVYLVEPQLLSDPIFRPGIRISLENEILPALLADGVRMYAFSGTGRFLDIGLPDDYLRSPEILDPEKDQRRVLSKRRLTF